MQIDFGLDRSVILSDTWMMQGYQDMEGVIVTVLVSLCVYVSMSDL